MERRFYVRKHRLFALHKKRDMFMAGPRLSHARARGSVVAERSAGQESLIGMFTGRPSPSGTGSAP